MERQTLIRRAKSLMAIVNGTEKHECFHIDALVPDDRDNIIIEAKGGVDNLSPFSYNRRATVKVQ